MYNFAEIKRNRKYTHFGILPLNMNQNGEYTKHYYADALRIASKIGSGFSQNLCDEANQIGNLYPDYLDDRMNKQQGEMIEELTELINGNQIMDINPIPYPEADLCNLFGDEREDALFFYHSDHLGSTGMITDNSSNITQGFLYAPFGEILSEYNPGWQSGVIPKNSFNAKELDEENGMYYYSARYYAPPTFISRDPMFEKYPSISPYTYCANNPLIFVDPTGKNLEGYINGEGADAATAQLDASTSLDITRDPSTGKLSATGEIKTQQDQDLYDAINDPTIRVDINATYSDNTSTGEKFDAGAFMGNTVTPILEDINTNNKPYFCISLLAYNKVETKQEVNPFKMAVLDMFYGNFGQNMLHEFMESYIGGQISQESGVSAGPAIENSPSIYIYNISHIQAPPQPGNDKSTPNDYNIFNKFINSTNRYGQKYF